MGGSPEPREVEAAVSQDHITVLQPGQWHEDLIKKREREREKRKWVNWALLWLEVAL